MLFRVSLITHLLKDHNHINIHTQPHHDVICVCVHILQYIVYRTCIEFLKIFKIHNFFHVSQLKKHVRDALVSTDQPYQMEGRLNER